MSELRVGVIGLGAMGAPMARHLAAAGLLHCIWNRTTTSAATLGQELAVQVAADPAELAAACNVVLTCVSADADLSAVLEQCLPGLEEGDVLIDASTVSPTLTRGWAEKLAARGVAMVDAPVSGGVEGARNGRLASMAGGKSADMERIMPVLEAYSASVTHMGAVGSGQATKAVNQVMVGGVAEAVCEALALAEKLNLPSERLISVLCAGAAGSWFLEHRGRSMMRDQFEPGFKSALLLKDLRICSELARELDISLPMVESTITDYEALLARGDGEADTSALIKVKRNSN